MRCPEFPWELWLMILDFIRPYERLRFLAIMDDHDHSEKLMTVNHVHITKDNVLSLYGHHDVSSNDTMDAFIWDWFIHSETDDYLWIENMDHKIYRNVERHFTEEWTIYTGCLHAGEYYLHPDFPTYESHFVDDVLGMVFGRFDRVLEYGYGDYDYY